MDHPAVFFAAVFVFIVILIAGLSSFIDQKSDCDSRHGVLVKGAFGYECIVATPAPPAP